MKRSLTPSDRGEHPVDRIEQLGGRAGLAEHRRAGEAGCNFQTFGAFGVKDYRHVVVKKLPREFIGEPVDKLDIEHRKIGLFLLAGEHRRRNPGMRAFDLVSRFLESIAQIEGRNEFVFGDQNS